MIYTVVTAGHLQCDNILHLPIYFIHFYILNSETDGPLRLITIKLATFRTRYADLLSDIDIHKTKSPPAFCCLTGKVCIELLRGFKSWHSV